jgi:hypothetical protein
VQTRAELATTPAILLLLGIVVVVASAAMLGYGIPIIRTRLGSTLIMAGTTALTGGLLLIGISAAHTAVRRLAEDLGAPSALRHARAEKPQMNRQPPGKSSRSGRSKRVTLSWIVRALLKPTVPSKAQL